MPHPASPHKQRWTHVSRIFFASLYRAGERELLENFEKDALFHDSLCMDIPLGPPIVSEGRGGGLCTGYFIREPRNYRKL